MFDISANNDASFTLYVKSKKVLRGSLQQVLEYLKSDDAPKPKAKRVRPASRTQRWSDAASAAAAALSDLKEVQEEYQEWYDNLPENLQQSAVGEKLDNIINIDIESALDAANEADGADLPLGFGRD